MRLAPPLTVTAALLSLAAVAAAPAAIAAPPTARTVTQLSGDLDVHDPALVTDGPGGKWYVFASGKPDKGGGTIDVRSSATTAAPGPTTAPSGTRCRRGCTRPCPARTTCGRPRCTSTAGPTISTTRCRRRAQRLGDRVGHQHHAGSCRPRLQVGRPGQGRALAARERLQRHRPGGREDDPARPGWCSAPTGTGSRWCSWNGRPGSVAPTKPHPPRRPQGDPQRDRRRRRSSAATAGTTCSPRGTGAARASTAPTGSSSVGSKTVTGPYVDRDGRELVQGGGTTLLESSGDRIGPGGESVSGGVIAYHYYDGTADGAPKLGLRSLTWADDGWPQAGRRRPDRGTPHDLVSAAGVGSQRRGAASSRAAVAPSPSPGALGLPIPWAAASS